MVAYINHPHLYRPVVSFHFSPIKPISNKFSYVETRKLNLLSEVAKWSLLINEHFSINTLIFYISSCSDDNIGNVILSLQNQ